MKHNYDIKTALCFCLIAYFTAKPWPQAKAEGFKRNTKNVHMANMLKRAAEHKIDMILGTGKIRLTPFEKKRFASHNQNSAGKPLVEHFRGKNGIPFPPRVVPPRIAKTVLTAKAEEAVQGYKKHLREFTDLKDLPRCVQGRTKEISRKRFKVERQNFKEKKADLLFVSKANFNESIRDNLGNDVILKIYDPSNPAKGAFISKLLGIPCLPFRLRIEGSRMFIYSGKNALECYGKDCSHKRTINGKESSR